MKFSIYILLIAITTMGSCKKFMEGRSQSDMTPQTTRDFSDLLFNEGYSQMRAVFQPAVTFMDDDIQCYSYPTAFDHSETAIKPLGAFSWQPLFVEELAKTGYMLEKETNSYKSYYDCISGCNIVLDAVDASTGTQAEKDQLKGEALALRAWYYFNLANLYGNPFNDSTTTPDKHLAVPLILSPDLSEKMPPRNTVAEVYAQIVKDAEQAVELLEKNRKMSDFRFNYLAANLLLSRIGLFTEKWETVISHADRVISDRPQLIDLNEWPEFYYPDASLFLPVCSRPNVETCWLYGSATDFEDFAISNVYAISEDLAGKYELNDLRRVNYFEETPEFLREYAPSKYLSKKRMNNASDLHGGSAFRSSEAYLSRAEAYAQLYSKSGDPVHAQKALADLNFLRSKRFKPADFQPLTPMPAPDLLQFCRDERRRELFVEGHRWYDLRRYGMPAISHVYSVKGVTDKVYLLKAHDPQYTLPLPPAAMILNHNLVQNPVGPTRVPVN